MIVVAIISIVVCLPCIVFSVCRAVVDVDVVRGLCIIKSLAKDMRGCFDYFVDVDVLLEIANMAEQHGSNGGLVPVVLEVW